MVLFLIATYNRPHLLARLIGQIQKTCPFPFSIIVVDDGSLEDYTDVRKYIEQTDGQWLRCNINHGRKGYHKVVSKLFQEAKNQEFDYVIKLDDDITLHPQAIERSLGLFSIITQHRNKRVLNMWVDHRAEEKVWTNIRPKITRIGGQKVRRVGWIDGGNWITNRRVLKILNWQCPKPPQRWWDRPGDSSGVGKYLSMKLDSLACKIFMPIQPMIYHGDHNSQMHPNKKNRPIEMTSKPW